MCEVNRGQGGVSNYGETDCKERQTCVRALYNKKGEYGHVQKHMHNIK